MQGTHCVSGSGVGVVVATGDETVFGRIAKLTNEPKTGMTTLEKEVLRFVVIIVSLMISMIIVVIIVWYSILLQLPRLLPLIICSGLPGYVEIIRIGLMSLL